MNWDDVDEIIFDGNQDDIKNLGCPECGGKISLQYIEEFKTLACRCLRCGTMTKGHGVPYVPNFVKFFGNEYITEPIEVKAI